MPKAWVVDGNLVFRCPGCNELHGSINVGPRVDGRPKWEWNGDEERPTLSPSVLIRSGHYADPNTESCWCTYNKEHPEKKRSFQCGVCHSFVREGQIQFLSDCTHGLAGQTVPLPEVYEDVVLELMKFKRGTP
jgi:hypothetical protein